MRTHQPVACRAVVSLFIVLLANFSSVASALADDPVALVRSLLNASKPQMGFGRAKLALDHFVDPTVDVSGTIVELDRMAATVEKMLAAIPSAAAQTDLERMKALRVFLYEPGWWNNHKPFSYDLSDPYGRAPGAQLLSSYLATRKGNCVSMPVLFLALAERLGLQVTLSTAPDHLFVKWTDRATGKTWNLEATSGGGFTRDEHYRKLLPMTDQAIANGVYLKPLSRAEAVDVLATNLLGHLIDTGRHEDAIATADILLDVWPVNVQAMIGKGSAYYGMLARDFITKYPDEADIPNGQLPEAQRLHRENIKAFEQAAALGWQKPSALPVQ